MTEKEIAELRRRFTADKSNVTKILGCYVNEDKEIVSEFRQSLTLMPEDEQGEMLSLLKRTLSGTLLKNLIDITFSTEQVVDSLEHRLLMSLRNSSLEDENAVHAFFERVAASLYIEGGYLILLAFDRYDVPYRSKDGGSLPDASSDVFSYIVCGVCPVKVTKPQLSYHINENEFINSISDWLVSSPELGFMFPAFDDRSANIYNALYYSRDTAESHTDFVEAIFNCEIPRPAAEQKEVFETILEEALAEDCSFAVVQAVHSQLCEVIETAKANKEEAPAVSKEEVKTVLKACSVPETRIEAFEERFCADFGEETALSPRNIVDTKQFMVNTPEVKITVSPESSYLIETRIINGKKYILINAEEGVTVNGVNITVSESKMAAGV